MTIHTNSIRVDSENIFEDVRFSGGVWSKTAIQFQFLSVIETSRVPFAFIAGPPQDVWTEDESTTAWFAEQLEIDPISCSQRQSRFGILVETESRKSKSPKDVPITEVLFYASANVDQAELEASFCVKALPLCSDVISYLPSPPLSPKETETVVNSQFLPPLEGLRSAALSEERKRKQVSNVFEEATERRRKARRKGGESVSAAASQVDGINILVGQKKPKSRVQHDSSLPAKPTHARELSKSSARPHSRTGSISATAPHDQTHRPLSRSPSISSEIRPTSRRGQIDNVSKRSGLSRVSSFAAPTSLEEKNKEAISRLIMAGMRLYGLQQRKKPGHVRRGSEMQPQPSVNASSLVSTEDVSKDEEYKLVYHQTYKGAVFAFRRVMATEPLHANPACLQDTVDKFLAIFCNDPLAPA